MGRNEKNPSGSRELLKEFVLSAMAGIVATCIYNLYADFIRLLLT